MNFKIFDFALYHFMLYWVCTIFSLVHKVQKRSLLAQKKVQIIFF